MIRLVSKSPTVQNVLWQQASFDHFYKKIRLHSQVNPFSFKSKDVGHKILLIIITINYTCI